MPFPQWPLLHLNSFTFNKTMKHTFLPYAGIAVAATVLCSCSSDEGWGRPRVHGREVPTLTPLPPELDPEVQQREAARAERKRQAAIAQNQPTPEAQTAVVSQPQPPAEVQAAAIVAPQVAANEAQALVQAKPVQIIPPPAPEPVSAPTVQQKKAPQASVAQTQPKPEAQKPEAKPVTAQTQPKPEAQKPEVKPVTTQPEPQKIPSKTSATQTQPKPAMQAPALKPAVQAPAPKPAVQPVVQPVVKPQTRPVFSPAQKKRYPVMPGQNRGLKLRD